MKNLSFLKITLVSLSFLSVSVFSIKIFEVHLHFGTSAGAQSVSPLFKVEPNAKFPDHWDISIPNDGQWHDTGLLVPSNREFVSFSPMTAGADIANAAVRVGTQEITLQPAKNPASPITGYYLNINKENQNLPISIKNVRGQANDILQLRIWVGNSVRTETHSQK